jgi:hypothetical protein
VPQEQFSPPEELLGLEISNSKYYFFVFFSCRLLLGILLYKKDQNIRTTPVTQDLILEGTLKPL